MKKVNKAKTIILSVVSLVLGISGCGSYHYDYNFEESNSYIENKDFMASISIVNGGERFDAPMNAYRLMVVNRSDKDIEINWNKTSFIFNGQTEQGFMFEGIRYINRNASKNPTLIMPNSSYSQLIYPNALVEWRAARTRWLHYTIPDGESGVYLILNIGKKEVKEKLIINKKTKKVKDF